MTRKQIKEKTAYSPAYSDPHKMGFFAVWWGSHLCHITASTVHW